MLGVQDALVLLFLFSNPLAITLILHLDVLNLTLPRIGHFFPTTTAYLTIPLVNRL
jgi:hypothetical protein